jgi:hypothetical protein
VHRAILAFVLLGLASPVVAAEPSRWEFEASVYGWIPGNFGTLEVDGRSAAIDATIYDVLHLVFDGDALAGAGWFSARYDRWSAFVDAFGGYAEESVNEKVPTRFCTLCLAATAELTYTIFDVGVGYRVREWSLPERERPLSLGVYAGTRVMHFGSELRGSVGIGGSVLRTPDVFATFNWADPMIGVRWEVPVLDRLTADFRGDIGGFGASSDLIWGLVAGIRYWTEWAPYGTRPWVSLGYRAVAFDRDFGAAGNIDLQLRGPYSGVGVTF